MSKSLLPNLSKILSKPPSFFALQRQNYLWCIRDKRTPPLRRLLPGVADILCSNKIYEIQKGWIVFIGRIVVASSLMALIVHFMNMDTFAWRELEQAERFIRLLLVIISAIAGYLAMLWLLGLRLAHLKG